MAMNRRLRYAVTAALVVALVYVGYSHTESLSGLWDRTSEPPTLTLTKTVTHLETATTTATATATVTVPASAVTTRANATFVMLTRNSDLEGALSSIRSIEDRFNTRYGYPYVFLNDQEFSDVFKKQMSVLTGNNAQFGVIPPEHWNQPSWIDEAKAERERAKMVAMDVKYGDSVAYRNMCRFNSGFFFKHELMLPYRYYWRIEPEVKFHCDIHTDPFVFLQANGKVYGFTIAVYEIAATVRSLWSTVSLFMNAHPEYLAEGNAMDFLSSDRGRTYNRCHFWSNFEIADMDFYRGDTYQSFFKHLDEKGGFYYERWGDAPVHSIAAGLFLNKRQIHFFDDIGYQHDDWSHCPAKEDIWRKGRCLCSSSDSFDYQGGSCKDKWDKLLERA